MLKICICDDEPTLCKNLHKLIGQYMGDREFEVMEYHDIPGLLNSTFNYDLLFLDIRFHGEDVGVEAAKKLREKGEKAIIIFLTSLPQYAPDGYETEAFRYLLKPVEMDKLATTMDAAIVKIESQRVRVTVAADSGIVLMKVRDIRYIESTARRRMIYAKDQTVETWETMDELYSKLPKDQFVFLQKGLVSNLRNIQRVKNNVITLKSGLEVSLSRIYKQDFWVAFNRYVEGGK